MDHKNNASLLSDIVSLIGSVVPFELGLNKKRDITRLLFEISRRDGSDPADILKAIALDEILAGDRGGIYDKLKARLIKLRYPSFAAGHEPRIFPVKVRETMEETPGWKGTFDPENIFVEKSVAHSDWVLRFTEKFPRARVVDIGTFKEGVSDFSGLNPVERYDRRGKNIFLVRNKNAFIKVCPCTKGYKRCGYWILNMGFGCPIDCSYCFLQLYSNSPGIILPANVDDYVGYVREFDRKVSGTTRVGTGEFADSLALDRYTGYSNILIPLFARTEKLVLELKTKVSGIDLVLEHEPHEKVVLSWSVNSASMAERFEKGGSPLSERIDAAERAAKRGFRVGFHFDPVIYYRGWEDGYKETVESIFSRRAIREKAAWVSLGTLRYTPGLKESAEKRFDDNLLYYWGEFFEDTDGKMRYPVDLRVDIYRKMAGWLKSYKTAAWVYLCMEPEEVWGKVGVYDER
ncbi:MAG: hypothetical protein HQL30_10885 [Candidatus Omnitrophica bacterium]|nr:hypothetical protein [Candidatus Omnitrophota bacterium]